MKRILLWSNIMRKEWDFHQPHTKAKILGIILIIIGISLLFSPSLFFIKLGFASLLIGFFMIVMVTEKTVPESISNAQIKGQADAVKQITSHLNLKGNALFLPQSSTLNTERIFIPLKNNADILPDIDDEFVFATGVDGTTPGIALPPSGLHLLHEVEKETSFQNTDIEHVQEKLQSFVGMDILKSVMLKQKNKHWELTLEKPQYCSQDVSFCKQYPCPSCSAVLTAITKATNQKIQIQDVVHNGRKTTFHFTMKR